MVGMGTTTGSGSVTGVNGVSNNDAAILTGYLGQAWNTAAKYGALPGGANSYNFDMPGQTSAILQALASRPFINISSTRQEMPSQQVPIYLPQTLLGGGAGTTDNRSTNTTNITNAAPSPLGGYTQKGAFIPPNYPNMPQATNVDQVPLPGFSHPGMVQAGNPYQMPTFGGGGGGGGMTPPVAQGNQFAGAADWNDIGPSGGGGPPQAVGFGGLGGLDFAPEAILAKAMQGQRGGGGSPAQVLVPPPPPSPVPPAVLQAMQRAGAAVPSELPPFAARAQEAAAAQGGGGRPVGGQAQAPKTDPAGQGQVPPPPQDVAADVKKMFPGLAPQRDPYGASADDITKKFADDAKAQVEAIDKRYEPEITTAYGQLNLAKMRGNQIINELNMLPTDDQLMQKSGLLARQQANLQERDYNPLKQLMFGRIPDQMGGRAAREGLLAKGFFDQYVKARDHKAKILEMGLNYATDEIKSAGTNLNNLMARRNQDVANAQMVTRALATNQTNYSKGMSTNDRGIARNQIAGTDVMLKHQDRVAQVAARREIAQANIEAMNRRLDIMDRNAATSEERLGAYQDYVKAMVQNMPLRTDADRAKALASVHSAAGLMADRARANELIATAEELLGGGEEQGAVAGGGAAQ